MSPNDHRRTFSSDLKRFFTALAVLPISVYPLTPVTSTTLAIAAHLLPHCCCRLRIWLSSSTVQGLRLTAAPHRHLLLTPGPM